MFSHDVLSGRPSLASPRVGGPLPSGVYTGHGSSHREPATASWSWRVSQPKAEREEFEGGGARAAACPGGPGRLTFVAHSSKSGVAQYWQGVPGAVRARIRPGSASFALFFINTVFWSGTCFVSVSAAPLPGRRLWLKESMKKSFLQKKDAHILTRIWTIPLRIGALLVRILRIALFGLKNRHRERSDL